jgi:hypothetical protein
MFSQPLQYFVLSIILTLGVSMHWLLCWHTQSLPLHRRPDNRRVFRQLLCTCSCDRYEHSMHLCWSMVRYRLERCMPLVENYVRRKHLMTNVFINFSSSLHIHHYSTQCLLRYIQRGMKPCWYGHHSIHVLMARTPQVMKHYLNWPLLQAIKTKVSYIKNIGDVPFLTCSSSFFKIGPETSFIKVVPQTHKAHATKIMKTVLSLSKSWVSGALYMQNHRSHVVLCDGSLRMVGEHNS